MLKNIIHCIQESEGKRVATCKLYQRYWKMRTAKSNGYKHAGTITKFNAKMFTK